MLQITNNRLKKPDIRFKNERTKSKDSRTKILDSRHTNCFFLLYTFQLSTKRLLPELTRAMYMPRVFQAVTDDQFM